MNKKEKSKVLYCDAVLKKMEPEYSLPAKFERMLRKLKLSNRVKKKNVGIKMHYGGGLGYTTIHPVFIKVLVNALKKAGAKSIKVMDQDVENGIDRGYTPDIIGCDVKSAFGKNGKHLYKQKIGFKTLDHVYFGGEAVDCDFLIDLSHVKAHGACGFGGALKNIAMGMVPNQSRGLMHNLEGGISYDKDKCTFCLKCQKACPNDAVQPDKKKKEINFFYHHCTFCQHCVMVCPEKALKMKNRKFEDFSKGMALVCSAFLKKFKPSDLLFINFLTNITMYCDCWEFSSPSLVPDIGILASNDIVAIENASLDMVKTENFLPSGLPKGRKLRRKGKHLFEKVHGKDPYVMINYLQEYYGGSRKYEVKEVS